MNQLQQKMLNDTKIIICDSVDGKLSDFTHELYLKNKNQLNNNLEIFSFYAAVEFHSTHFTVPRVIQFNHQYIAMRDNLYKLYDDIIKSNTPADRVKQRLTSEYGCIIFDTPQAISIKDLFQLSPLRIISSNQYHPALTVAGTQQFGLFSQPSTIPTLPATKIDENSGLISNNRKCNICHIL